MSFSVVTGANRGIGLELVKELRGRGRDVVAVCRKSTPELDKTGARVVAGVDVSDPKSIEKLATQIDGDIDLLINNAGIMKPDHLEEVDPDAVLSQFRVNSMGPLLCTRALLPRMKAGAKVAIITSRMGSIADNTSGAAYGYRMSKAAVNAAGVSLARDLEPKKIGVVILHPGFVRTDMTGNNGSVDPAESAKGLLARIDELELSTTGRFLHMNGEALPW